MGRLYNTEEQEAAVIANREAANARYHEHELVVRAHRTKVRAVGLTGMWREQGEFYVPDAQRKLDNAMLGQIVWCPNCGTDHPATTEGFFTCTKCRAHYTVSLGMNARTREVGVVRMDRHR
jgi:hypothetical protein